MSKQISTEVSTQVLHYEPSGPPVNFEVVVYNDSSQFATFQLELSAAGADGQPQQEWYRIAPSVSSKLPSGDRARFTVEIFAIPPIPGGFTGTMNLTVRVFSLELRDEDRQVLRLVIEGSGILSPKLTMPTRQFKVYPDSQVELSVDVYNPNRQSADVTVSIDGIRPTWFPDGAEKRLHLRAGETANTVFLCRIPVPVQAPSQVYPFTVQAAQPMAMPGQLQGSLTVLPTGFVAFQYKPLRQQIPSQPGRWRNPRASLTSYQILCLNQSNVVQQIAVEAVYQDPREERRRQLALAEQTAPTATAVDTADTPEAATAPAERPLPPPKNALVVQPNPAQVPVGDRHELRLDVYRRLPWLGWPRRKRLQIQAKADSELELRQNKQVLELDVFPVLPFWLQLLTGLAGLLLLGLIWWLVTHQGHSGPVNSVQMSGRANEAVSASDDQTLRLWQIQGRKLSAGEVLYRGDKAIRVVRYRPVDNNWVWAGFENGDIQGWNLLSDQQFFYSYRQDDRVFDLALTRDARSLFSGHGSGLVLQWDTSPADLRATRTEPDRGFEVDFAVQSLALVGSSETHLAIAGRYNQLVLLNLATESFRSVDYRAGSSNDYIFSVATALEKPNLLATADNRGYITLWNLSACLSTESPCEIVDEWSTGHNGEAVRAVALSDDGCYLASVGDDGRAMLWPLTSNGTRQPNQAEGEVLRRSEEPLNAVDVLQNQNRVLLISGGNDAGVRLRAVKVSNSQLPPGQCSIGN
ncbi:hypothetical protein [Almyronema epifaneia]|uniref:WD40 repeat domain-containing protein n=1 Tax=Almyronema epifaneia S1 TaxID=2991925 RepID=A0ABW6ID93_9CYAN